MLIVSNLKHTTDEKYVLLLTWCTDPFKETMKFISFGMLV